MQKFFSDTNIFLRYLLRDEEQQYLFARDKFIEAKEGKMSIILTSIVVFELVFALHDQFKFSRDEIANMLGDVLAMPYLQVEEETVLKMALIFWVRSSLDLADCYLKAKADFAGAQVLTFDQKLSKKTKKARG